MNTVNDVMEDLEELEKYIVKDGNPVTLKQVIENILEEDKGKETKRELARG